MSPASQGRRATALMVLVLASGLPGCAFQNPDNRRTWNAFEENWVPDTEPAFSFALPLTIPGGLLAILVDVLVVHPFSVIDDAWADSVKSWDDLDWQGDYWFEAGVAPFRALGTGALLVVGLVGRSLFDIPVFREDDPNGKPPAKVSQGPEPAPDPAEVTAKRAALSAWLQTLLRGDCGPGPLGVSTQVLQVAWNLELQQLSERVLSEAPYRPRIAYYRWASRHRPSDHEKRWLGLLDRDARVRATLLVLLAETITIPADVRAALLADPDPVVAELAWQLLADDH